jgi:tetratricopeptide (TPR) repeat protein
MLRTARPVVASLLLLGAAAPTLASVPPAPVPPTTAATSAAPSSLDLATRLAALDSAPALADKLAIVDELATLGDELAPAAAAFLTRTRASSVAERRAVLASIKASIPDATGKFATPARQKAEAVRADDEFDWLAELSGKPGTSVAYREVVADVTALRALSLSRRSAAATVIAETGFAADTMIYRDECGRRLRAMQPYSVPALLREAKREHPGGKVTDRMRYAAYQLERIDRADPDKALIAAGVDEALVVEVFDAFRATHHREAVYAVLRRIDVEAPRVRAAARAAWSAYVDGPAPPPGRMRHLALPGGKFAARATPVELNYRQLAEQELRTAIQDLFGETLDEDAPIDPVATTARIYKHYDDKRAARDRESFGEALRLVDQGDLAGAVTAFDRLLAADPTRGDRAEMAPTYLTFAAQREAAGEWEAAARAYSKVHGLDPTGAGANHALARYHFALGKQLEAAGKDGGPEFKLAAQLEPADPEVKQAAAPPAKARPWLLYAGGGVGGLALLLLLIGVVRRRA